jgi:hypothetical protein
MKVDLYAQCWNDSSMLPYFFRHYDGVVSRYVIYDDGSDTQTLDILRSHPKVDLRQFVRSDPRSFTLSEKALSDECWKESRGEADWVIVTDIDEHLFHPSSLAAYLRACAARGDTMIPALGFQMISDSLPARDDVLSDSILLGMPWENMMKVSIFDPNRIEEIGFTLGRHRVAPKGVLRIPEHDELFLLHYKYLNLNATHARHVLLRTGLRPKDHENGWGHKYSWSLEELSADWLHVRQNAVDVRLFSGCLSYPITPWWNPYRIGDAEPPATGSDRN